MATTNRKPKAKKKAAKKKPPSTSKVKKSTAKKPKKTNGKTEDPNDGQSSKLPTKYAPVGYVLPPDERRCTKILDPQTGRRCPSWTAKILDKDGNFTGEYHDYCILHGDKGKEISRMGGAAHKTLWAERREKAKDLESLRTWEGYQTFLMSLIRDEIGKDRPDAKSLSMFLTRLEKTLEATQIPPVFMPKGQPGADGDPEEYEDYEEALMLKDWTKDEIEAFCVHGIWPANRPRPGFVAGWETDGTPGE